MRKRNYNRLLNITPDGKRTVVSFVLLVAFLIVMYIVQPSIMKFSRVVTITNGQMCLLLAGIGQTLVLLVGGIDLSVGGVICLCNSIAALYMPDSIPGMILMSMIITALGVLIGTFNGFIVTRFQVQPFVVTFTVNYVLLGIAQKLLPIDGGNPPSRYVSGLLHNFGPVSLSMILVVLILVGWIFVRRTRFMRNVYAVGCNAKASALNGINVSRVKMMTFAISGGMAALAGLWRTAQLASGSPDAGDALTMPSITISVIGGTSMSGGMGGVVGTVVGAYILRLIQDLLTFMGAKSFWSTVFQGVFLVITVGVCSVIDMKKGGKKNG
jgi:ribose transport system permease protein